MICKPLDRPVTAIVTVYMHSLLEQTDSTVVVTMKQSVLYTRTEHEVRGESLRKRHNCIGQALVGSGVNMR